MSYGKKKRGGARMKKPSESEAVFMKFKNWKAIEGELCHVKSIQPMGGVVKDGVVVEMRKTVPFASITFECKKIDKPIIGYIDSKIDFLSLWQAFEEKGENNDVEVLMSWSIKHYRGWVYRMFPVFFPKMLVLIASKGTYGGSWKWEDSTDSLVLIHSLLPSKVWLPFAMKGSGVMSDNQCKTKF
jgi:hypothetical protein